jgi:flagella basal body P-ring formation protein FlgA
MTHKIALIRTVAFALVAFRAAAVTPGPVGAASANEPSLRVHLPREVTVEKHLLNLGQVSVVRGDGPVATRAGKIGLGRLSLPGQKLVLDRPTILGRLASNGIPADQVRLTGAAAVTVRRRQEIIHGQEFIDVAQALLAQVRPSDAVVGSVALARPKDMIVPAEAHDVEVTPRVQAKAKRGVVTVRVTVVADGATVGTRDIPLRLRYRRHKVVTSKAVAEGAVLTPDNVKVESYVSDRPDPVGWKPPYGLAVVRALPAEAEVRPDLVRSPQPEVVIRRNETVVVRVERPGLLVSAVGIALQQARAGEPIKVRNTDSMRVIVCKVNPDGTVTPVF